MRAKKAKMRILVDGKPASMADVAEARGGETWKAYLEEHRQRNKESLNRFLAQQLGDYISLLELRKIAGINAKEIDKLKRNVSIRSTKLQGRWYYSITDIITALNPSTTS